MALFPSSASWRQGLRNCLNVGIIILMLRISVDAVPVPICKITKPFSRIFYVTFFSLSLKNQSLIPWNCPFNCWYQRSKLGQNSKFQVWVITTSWIPVNKIWPIKVTTKTNKELLKNVLFKKKCSYSATYRKIALFLSSLITIRGSTC